MRLSLLFAVMVCALLVGSVVAQNRQIDLMVVYNDYALEQIEGGVGAMEAWTDYVLERTNRIFASSEVHITVNSLGVHWVDYDTPDTLYNDVVRLRETDDGHIDDVHLLRDALGADLIFMFCGHPDAVGVWQSYWIVFRQYRENNVTLSFGAVRPAVIGEPRSLFDFITSQLGRRRQTTSIDSDFPGSAGYVFQGESGGWYRTLYGDYQNASGEPAFTVELLSNPNVLYDGVPSGVSGENDNAGVMNLIADHVEPYRTAQGSVVHLLNPWEVVVEGEGASAEMRVGVFPAQDYPFSVDWMVRDWTGTAGVDTVQVSGELEMPAGERVGSVFVEVVPDHEVEGMESVDFLLTHSTGPPIGMDQGSIQIVDDEQRVRGTRDHLLGVHALSGNEPQYLDSNDDQQIDIADVVWASNPKHVDDIIVDNRDPGFSVPIGSRRTTNFLIGWPFDQGDYFYQIGIDETVAQWSPVVETTGRYEVSAWYVSGENRTTRAVYEIHSASGVATAEVNQQQNGSMWNPLGTYRFKRGVEGRVRLSNDILSSDVVIFDAIRLRCVQVLDDDDENDVD